MEKQSDLEEGLQCTLCYGHMYEPLTTPCGHSFCRICLLRSLDHRDVCPLCRSSLKGYLAIHQVLKNETRKGKMEEKEKEKKKKALVQAIFIVLIISTTPPDR